ncbi:MFS_1 domain-containing protein [Rhizoctonia solani AG-1 IA]|uniref:MFS_1 domain-containing protein n=1 Tax=Thanatephorus cucumeris (strain AG1-IA) TaxID=983506 RepID=L8X6M9_THACA|nr:MFS_1 domain-containing protein [Rhizoctonia solani AG-1 IA]
MAPLGAANFCPDDTPLDIVLYSGRWYKHRHGSMMNGLQSVDGWKEYFGHPTPKELGLFNAIQSIGSLAAIPPAPFLSDRFGRRAGIFVGSSITLGGAITQLAQLPRYGGQSLTNGIKGDDGFSIAHFGACIPNTPCTAHGVVQLAMVFRSDCCCVNVIFSPIRHSPAFRHAPHIRDLAGGVGVSPIIDMHACTLFIGIHRLVDIWHLSNPQRMVVAYSIGPPRGFERAPVGVCMVHPGQPALV